jgi:hypothetical protein
MCEQLGVRWMGNEEGAMPLPSWGAYVYNDSASPFNGNPTAALYIPPSCDTVLDEHYWFWQADAAAHRRSTCALVNVYLTTVGRACNLMLNIAPDDQGGLSAADLQVGGGEGCCMWVGLGGGGGRPTTQSPTR